METHELKDLLPEIQELNNSDKEALEEYYQSVQLLSKKLLNLEFNNKDKFHGAIVMAQIFHSAHSTINLFAGNFNGDICGKSIYSNALKHAVSANNIKLNVVFEDSPNVDSSGYKVLKSLADERPENVTVKVLTANFKKSAGTGDTLNHFVVADDSIFRYEVDKQHYKAFCNFDDKKVASKLNSNFEVLEYNSQPIKL